MPRCPRLTPSEVAAPSIAVNVRKPAPALPTPDRDQGGLSVDRRSFVVGSAAAAAALATGRASAQEAYPTRPVTFDQSVPARRRRRRRRPPARRRARADRQAAGRDRDQGRRRRPGRRAVRRQRQARRLHAADAHRLDLGLRRGRQAVRPAGEVHARRLHPDRALHRRPDACSSSTTSSRTRP